MTNRFFKNLRIRLPLHGYLGFLIILTGQIFLAMRVQFFIIWLTPIMWTGYILLIDSIVSFLRGASWLTTKKQEFPFLLLFSVGVWLVFEVYNFRLRNWIYLGVPANPLVRDIAYFWSFATIMPAVFETADLIGIVMKRQVPAPKPIVRCARSNRAWIWFGLGIAMVVIPPATSSTLATHLFGFVWVGFILLLDPINERLGAFSFSREWRTGNWTSTLSLLCAGLVCGFLWEAWNFQAASAGGGHWEYMIPEALRIFGLHFGKMPVLGLLGFPPFAMELRAFYSLLYKLFELDRVLNSPDWSAAID